MNIENLNTLSDETFELKKQFLKYANITEREGIDKLLFFLDESGFYNAPASTKYHLAEEGGLLKHSLNVVNIAIEINKALTKPVDEKSLILVSLFHDIGKHKYFNKDYYTPKVLKSGKPAAQPYEINKDLINVPHEISSIHILSRFIELTEYETWAILQHNGMYSDLKYKLQGNETPLQMILHWADMWASRVLEKSIGN